MELALWLTDTTPFKVLHKNVCTPTFMKKLFFLIVCLSMRCVQVSDSFIETAWYAAQKPFDKFC